MANLKQTLFCQSTTTDVRNKDMLRNLSRTGYASLALSQKQGTILKLFLVRNRVRLLTKILGLPGLKLAMATLQFSLSCLFEQQLNVVFTTKTKTCSLKHN